jgi:hypothetical protein
MTMKIIMQLMSWARILSLQELDIRVLFEGLSLGFYANSHKVGVVVLGLFVLCEFT